jgi:hypothetical protein
MPFNTNITPGRPPVLWSDVNEAFTKVNENFDILVATIGSGSGLTPIDFTSLDTSVKPTTDNLYELGDITHKWRAVFTGEHTVIDPLNGLWAGNAQIKGVGYTMNLPANSTVGGDPITGLGADLIIDPAKTFFKEIQVNDDLSVVATTFGDTVNFLSGSGVGLAVSSGADSITFSNTGVLSVAAGSGITAATVSGVATVTNDGVRSLQSTTALPSGRTTGVGININGSTGDNLRITNTGVISITASVGITVSTDTATGDVTITNSAPAGNTFAQVEVNGDSANRLVADASSDILNINSGEGITLTKSVGTDTLTIAVNPVFDLKGSVFGDDSSILVDAVSGYIYGNVSATTLRTAETKIALGNGAGATAQGNLTVAIGQDAGNADQGSAGVAIGYFAGKTTQEAGAVAIGYTTAQITQRTGAVAIGWSAGQTNQGANAIAIGYRAGFTNQNASSIVLNASGVALEAAAAGFFVNPLRFSSSSAKALMYDAATSELIYSSVLEFIGSTISTSDSSGLTVDVQTTFNTDVSIENDLTVRNNIIPARLKTTEIEGITNELNIYSDWAKDTGVSIYSETGVESVTLTSNRVVGIVTGVGGTQREWVFDTSGRIQFPDTRYQTGAAISIADLKVLVAACADFAAFKTAIAALA